MFRGGRMGVEGGQRPLGRHRPHRFSTPTMPRPVILPISKISRLFIHIAIFWLGYELNTILGLFIHSSSITLAVGNVLDINFALVAVGLFQVIFNIGIELYCYRTLSLISSCSSRYVHWGSKPT